MSDRFSGDLEVLRAHGRRVERSIDAIRSEFHHRLTAFTLRSEDFGGTGDMAEAARAYFESAASLSWAVNGLCDAGASHAHRLHQVSRLQDDMVDEARRASENPAGR